MIPRLECAEEVFRHGKLNQHTRKIIHNRHHFACLYPGPGFNIGKTDKTRKRRAQKTVVKAFVGPFQFCTGNFDLRFQTVDGRLRHAARLLEAVRALQGARGLFKARLGFNHVSFFNDGIERQQQ